MRWFADENIHGDIVRELRTAGHDVTYAAEDARQVPDRRILEIAAVEGRIVLTEDKDFGELVFRDGVRSSGVVLLRLHGLHWSIKWTRLSGTIAAKGDSLYGHFTVIEPDDIRAQILQP